MPSIRKTKKRLKSEIVDNEQLLQSFERIKFPTLQEIYLYSVIQADTDQIKQKLQLLKKKKS